MALIKFPSARGAFRATLPFWLIALAGCAAAPGAPRPRLGALPFPGAFTLYTTADPDRLGRHRYGQWPRLFQADEKERGIIYTTRAGFVDVAHVRITIDWTRYYTGRVRRALTEGRSELALPTLDRAVFHVTLHYPHDWDELDAGERRRLADALALRAGQRLAYQVMTWHEVITWFGYRNVFFVDESPSSFTWDDTMSHVVGLRVAERALADRRRGFDDAVTVALARELKELGAVKREQTRAAARAVEGKWWASGRPLKRQFNVGMREFVVHPWLVRGLPFAPEAEPEPFVLPSLADVLGRDASDFYSLRIDPRIDEADRMRRHLAGRPRFFRRDRDVPELLRTVRSQMRRQFGDEVNQPWPGSSAEARAGSVASAGGRAAR